MAPHFSGGTGQTPGTISHRDFLSDKLLAALIPAMYVWPPLPAAPTGPALRLSRARDLL